jgi:NAD(P)-dependent dehydrogenase (short-subunit alcohol dehydrogenase family)
MGALDGKVAIVTGAGQGLGRCHAEFLAAEGASVVVNDISDAADETVAAITAAGGTAVAHRCDITDWAAGEELVNIAVDTFGDLDVLVNNAGFVRDAMSFSMTEDQFDAVVAVHLKGHFAPSRAAGSWWREQAKKAGEGAQLPGRRIITTTSESGLFGGPAQGNYASAKGGIITMTLVLARELVRYGVTVNCVAPRARTPMTEAMPMFAAPEVGFDRYDPANVSPMVGWLASDASAGVSGQVFIVLGDEVHRMAPTAIATSVSNNAQRFTVADLSAVSDQLFAGSDPGVPPWGGPPM